MGTFENGGDNITGFSVTTLQPIMVTPAENTPKEVLYLSNIDTQVSLTVTWHTLHVYGTCPTNHRDPDDVIRHALSKALVYYYPMAGRLRKTADGRLEVWCTGEGAVFVEASANCTLEEVGYLTQLTPCLKQLIYEYPVTYEHHDIPPLVIQVTHFLCGGFVLGFGLSHCMIDGLGFSQFLSAMADLARGMPLLSVTPEWKREILKPRISPPIVNFEHKELACINPSRNNLIDATAGLIQRSFLLTSQSLNKLKKDALAGKAKDDEQYLYCSTFEALAAFVWKSRVKALQIPLDEEVRLLFAVNVRKVSKPSLPEGYYGNGFFGACVAVSAKVVSESSLWYLVRMVKEAKARLTDEYLMSAMDFLELHRPEPQGSPPPTTTELYLSDWSRMAYSQVDFGWGEAMNVSTVSIPSVNICVFLPPPNTNADDKEKNGIRVVTCLPTKAMEEFNSEMKKLNM